MYTLLPARIRIDTYYRRIVFFYISFLHSFVCVNFAVSFGHRRGAMRLCVLSYPFVLCKPAISSRYEMHFACVCVWIVHRVERSPMLCD